jgi:hypothetical protein
MKGAKHHALRFSVSFAASDNVYYRYRRTIARRWSRLEDLFSSLRENERAFEVMVICLGFLPCLLMALVIFSPHTP